MSILSTVTSGKQIGAQIHVIAGDNGVGKTTWAADFPNVLIIDLENGSRHLNVDRIPPEKVPNYLALRDLLKDLKESSHTYKTIAIDSAESLEAIIYKHVCTEDGVQSIEDLGYGKGYAKARELMQEIMYELQDLQRKGITSIIVAHTQVKSKTDPAANQTYDRVIMRCNDKLAAIIRDLSDNVFYATYKVVTTKDSNTNKTKAFGDGHRIMYTGWRPGFDAKNRLELPHELPLSYGAFTEACLSNEESDPDAILSEIKEIALALDDVMKKRVAEQIEKSQGNTARLKQVKDRLIAYVSKGA